MQVATPNSAISSGTPSSTPSSIAAAVAVAVAGGGGGPIGPADNNMTQLILDHPLYPLLQMVFQKCELATSSPRDAQAETICSSDSFSEDIRNFISESRLRNLSLTTGCHDVDKFMLKSIEVLKIHLLELEKVHQLCDNFCQRYINCLKGKLPIDLVVDDGSSRDTNSASRNGSSNQQDGGPSSNNSGTQNGQTNSDTQQQQQQNSTQQQNNGHNHQQHHHHNQQHHHSTTNNNNNNNNNNNHHHPHQHHDIGANGYSTSDAAVAAAAAYHQSYGAYGAAGYAGAGGQNPYAAHHAAYAASTVAGMPHYQSPGDHHSASIKHETSNSNHHHHRELTASSGSSGTETTTAPDRQLHDDVRSPTGSTGSFLGDASLGSGDGTECEDDDNRSRRQQKKRGIFPKAATNIMRAWLFQHLNHPYPSEDQKKQLAEETGLTILQVNNWSSGNIMAGGPGYSPDGTGMGYMLDGSQPFRSGLAGVDAAGGMNPLASHAAAMSSAAAMGAYSAASAQHLSQYGRQQQQSHAAMLGLSTPPTGPHMMGAHPTLPPHDYY